MLAYASGLAAMLTLAFLLGFLTKGTVPITSTMIAESAAKEGYDGAYSLNSLSTSIANTIAPIFFGAVASFSGVSMIFILCAAAALLSSIPAMLIIENNISRS